MYVFRYCGCILAPDSHVSDIYRVGRISHNQATDCLLRVLEVDIPRADLTSGDSRTPRSIFPDEAPSVDGLVICYDASEDSSFKLVERTIG